MKNIFIGSIISCATLFCILFFASKTSILSVFTLEYVSFLVQIKLALLFLIDPLMEMSLDSYILVFFSILFGVNVVLIYTFYTYQRAGFASLATMLGSGSIVSLVIGMSCVSCGSIAIAFLSSFLGTSGFYTVSRMEGTNFSILGVLLLLVSIAIIGRRVVKLHNEKNRNPSH